MNNKDIAKMIEHAMLKPTMTDQQLEKEWSIALEHGVYSVCVKPCHIEQSRMYLAPTDVKIGSVIGFPHGSSSMINKIAESKQAIDEGVQELDVVVNIGRVLSGLWNYVADEIAAVTEVCQKFGIVVKIIFETCYLGKSEIIMLCQICSDLNINFIETSTGFGRKGATVKNVRLMTQFTEDHVQIKAAGGIQTLTQLVKLHRAGADRIGTSHTDRILHEYTKKTSLILGGS
jgi:deoxyribose-phosphate aldolase